ncbi:MAG: hypothetical protein A2138_06270 [Deltaproteobacteria bacterium RBG_16_71_12]|nr:MAG: hypothetical protein A2138_06270 [Deltaproteobacteria bacterium RBG_16_71_12]
MAARTVSDEASVAALQARLRKNLRRLAPWAAREEVSSFRVYDRDIPEVPLTIDRYGTAAGVHLHVSVFEPRHGIAEAAVQRWAGEAAAALAVDRARVHVKRRARGVEHVRVGEEGARLEVAEGGLRFLVNLTDYVDTGLFLDHRRTRARVRREAGGKRFLNLFSYTGSFTVYAAAGGAHSSCSLDLSATYCRWAHDNLRQNGLASAAHVIDRVDALAWLEQPAGAPAFELAVLDPPTVSTSKRASRALDVQADHPWLIARTLDRLVPGGVLYFSTNLLRFTLGAVAATSVVEVTGETMSPDFSRRPPIHRCWRIVK